MATFDERSAELSLEPLRRLAHALVLEKSSADDVVQEAWLAALEARGEIQGLGGWLAGTARRLARNRSRVERRREERERRAARPEAEPSTVESSARIEILREVLAAVDRLPQPYRDAVVLRYLDDLPPREIARRLDVPVNTARTHVRRGLERLRADLDAGPGRDRDALLAALLPLLGPGASSALPTANPLARTSRRIVMQHPIALAVSVLGLVATGWVWQHRDESGAENEALELAASPVAGEAAPPVEATPVPADPHAASKANAPAARAEASEAWTVRGYAYDGGGAELVGRVFAGGEAEGTPLLEERFHADATGTFAWELSPPTTLVTIEVAGDRAHHRGLPYRGWFLPGDDPPQTAVVALYPLDVMLQGRVVDADGTPVAGVSVALKLGDDGRAVVSAGDGSFALPWTSRYSGLQAIGAWLDGYAPGHATIDRSVPVSQQRFELRLEPELRLHGTVRDRAGNPVEGATVSVGGHLMGTTFVNVTGNEPVQIPSGAPGAMLDGEWPSIRTDAQGRWDLGGIPRGAFSVELIARAPGFRPTELRLVDLATAAKRSHGFSLTRGVTVTGRIRANGAPVWGAHVSVGDHAEEIDDVQCWTDPEGRFVLENVPSGRQHLWVWRRNLAQLRHDVTVSEALPEVELELQPDHRVAGVVLDASDEPVPWTLVMAEDASGAQPPRFLVGSHTNADGRFVLRSIPGGRVAVGVGGSQFQEVELDRDDVVVRLTPPEDEPEPATPSSSSNVVVIQGSSGTRPPQLPETDPVALEPVVPVTESSGSARIDGHLVAPAAVALEGQAIELAAVEATVAAGPWGTRTDAQGGFSFDNLPAGTFELRWLRRDGDFETVDLETRLTLAAGEARLEDLRPRGNATVRGRLEFMEIPGRPPSNTNVQMPSMIEISLSRMEGRTIVPGRRGTFARDGVFELEGVEAGNWAVQAKLEFDVSPGTTTSSVGMSHVRVAAEGVSEVVISVVRP